MRTGLVLLAIQAIFASTIVAAAAPPAATQPAIHWEKWSDDAFARAKREHKFVLMDLEAVWCHWCHVMDEITYSDPDVIRLIGQKYVAIKVDQDSRPDISNRYEDWGWPATIVFDADGGEIVKRQGYIPPGPMARMLQAIIDDPTPGPSVRPETKITFGNTSSLPADARESLQKKFDGNYDSKEGGWGTVHKYLDWDAIEWSTDLARGGDHEAETRARTTLAGARKLIDPAWGGIYQYSTDGDWEHPHYEKIMQFQAESMRTYARAYAQWHDPADLQATRAIRAFLKNFLTSPDGAFYTSQNADLVNGEHSAAFFALDDAGRRKLGIPRIDRHVYARENGWAIAGLVALYEAGGEDDVLADAVRAAQWVIDHRALPGGGFRHDEQDSAGPYLGDSLAMGRAFLALYEATGDRVWLSRARGAAEFVRQTFHASGDSPALLTAAPANRPQPRPELDENVAACRFFNLLSHYTGSADDAAEARNVWRYLSSPQILESRGGFGTGILLADRDRSTDPLHLTIVGPKSDPTAAALFRTALRSPVGYKRTEWWDPHEGPLPNPDVQYPQKKTAAFVCTANTCSAPITTPEALERKLGLSR